MPGSRCSPPMMSIITEHRMCWLSADVPCKPPGPFTPNASSTAPRNPPRFPKPSGTASPVLGLRPVRAGRLLVPKIPNPGSRTSSPSASASPMVANTPSTASLAALLLSPVRAAKRSAISVLFMCSPPAVTLCRLVIPGWHIARFQTPTITNARLLLGAAIPSSPIRRSVRTLVLRARSAGAGLVARHLAPEPRRFVQIEPRRLPRRPAVGFPALPGLPPCVQVVHELRDQPRRQPPELLFRLFRQVRPAVTGVAERNDHVDRRRRLSRCFAQSASTRPDAAAWLVRSRGSTAPTGPRRCRRPSPGPAHSPPGFPPAPARSGCNAPSQPRPSSPSRQHPRSQDPSPRSLEAIRTAGSYLGRRSGPRRSRPVARHSCPSTRAEWWPTGPAGDRVPGRYRSWPAVILTAPRRSTAVREEASLANRPSHRPAIRPASTSAGARRRCAPRWQPPSSGLPAPPAACPA